MRRILSLSFLFIFFPYLVSAQQVIADYDEAPADTNYWKYNEHVVDNSQTSIGGHYLVSPTANTDTGYAIIDYITDPVAAGSGALQVEYSVHFREDYGGYTKIEHWHPDTNGVYNFSAYDSISVMYYITEAQSLAGRVEFRLCLHDVSNAENGNNTYVNTQVEYYYSFHKILDAAAGWNEIKMPLIADGNFWNGEGFNLTGWAGITGNSTLDLNKIKGYTYEFSINSSGTKGDFSKGTIVVDHLSLKGLKKVELIFFNGKAIPSDMDPFAWNGTLEVVEDAGATENTNAMKWVQGMNQAWTGAGFNFATEQNLAMTWKEDSIQFKMKAEAGTGKLRLQFEDGSAPHLGINFDPVADGDWHDYKFALADFVLFDGQGDFDTSAVTVFQWMAEGTGSGKTIYIDDMWTGNPDIDVLSPAMVTGVDAVPAEFYNLVFWTDVAGESGAKYNVYASTKPITEINSSDVELIARGVAESEQKTTHWLYFPLESEQMDYYYAVECSDAAGNLGPAGVSPMISNNAKALATISPNGVANFVADGDPSEWISAGIVPFVIKPEDPSMTVISSVDDSLDLKGTVYLAIDDDALYVYADVIDDVYSFPAGGNWWDKDALQLFIGLYDLAGPAHSLVTRGEEPDYVLYFNEEGFTRDTPENGRIYTIEDANYHFEDFDGADYVIEARIPLDTLAIEGDSRFYPENGLRLPLDIYFHDNDGNFADGASGWEGNLGLSPHSTDNQWQFPSEWLYTWIGDTNRVSAIGDFTGNIVNSYRLEQNYPNPFNPETTIEFAISRPGNVEIVVYNLLGQNVATLLNERMEIGQHSVKFDGAELSSGIYFYTINAGEFFQTRKMILLK